MINNKYLALVKKERERERMKYINVVTIIIKS